MNLPCTVAVACVSFLLVFTLLGCTGSAHRDPVAGASSNALSQTPPVDAAAASASAMPPNEPLLGRVIGIDPGHNGRNWAVPGEVRKQIWNGRNYQDCNTVGTSTDDGYPESRFTLAVATHLSKLVRRAGGTAVLTRLSDDGVGPCVDVRARALNAAQVDVAIDIHADGGPASGRGFTILRPVPSGVNDSVVAPSREYAEYLRDAMVATGMPVSDYYGEFGFQDRSDLAGLNLSTVPQLLLESGNMRNSQDATLLTSEAFQRRVARAILDAMVKFLNRKASARGQTLLQETNQHPAPAPLDSVP